MVLLLASQHVIRTRAHLHCKSTEHIVIICCRNASVSCRVACRHISC